MRILSIQSSVAYGHAGNSSAVFPLQRLGHEVWAVNTVHFSNHTGYGSWRGPLLAPAEIAEVVAGIEERGVLPTCDAVLSGYQGAEAVGEVVLDAVAKVRAANPAAVYCCDPVMGDVGRGFFVRPGIPEFMRDRVVPAADVVTPNQFELEFLTGRDPGAVRSVADLLAAVAELHALGPATVLVTSVHTEESDPQSVSMLASDGARVLQVTTPLLPLSVNGAGDATAALVPRPPAHRRARAGARPHGGERLRRDAGHRRQRPPRDPPHRRAGRDRLSVTRVRDHLAALRSIPVRRSPCRDGR